MPDIANPEITPNDKEKLTERTVILVEGQDDRRFIGWMLKKLGISYCQIIEYGGKDQLITFLRLLATDAGFPDLEVLIVTRDADDNSENAFRSISDSVAAIGLQPPPRKNTYSGATPDIGVFLIGGQNGTGMLEDLCLGTVADYPAMDCVRNFWTCVEGLEDAPATKSEIAKSRVMSFLASRRKITRHIGEAAEKGYWNFDSETLSELREFLLHLQPN